MRKKFNYILGLFLIFISLTSSANAQQFINPFDTLQYDSVVAFDLKGFKEIIEYGRRGPFEINNEYHTLTKSQTSQLNKTMCDTAMFGGSKMACFEPHLGLVYCRNRKIVAYISVCLMCNYLISSPEIPSVFFSNPDNNSFPSWREGFSEKGVQFFSNLCIELNFSHCKKGQ